MSKQSVIDRVNNFTERLLYREMPEITEKRFTISHGWTINIETTRVTQEELDEGIYEGLQVGDVVQLAYYVSNPKGVEVDQVEVAIPFETHYRDDVKYLVGMYWGRR